MRGVPIRVAGLRSRPRRKVPCALSGDPRKPHGFELLGEVLAFGAMRITPAGSTIQIDSEEAITFRLIGLAREETVPRRSREAASWLSVSRG